MRSFCSVVLLALIACSSAEKNEGPSHAPSPAAQAIVDRVATQNADVARLSIHAVASGGSNAHIVASTVKGRIGDASDPEDFQAIKSGQPVVMNEGHNLDYTLPVQDASGQVIAIVGITISGAGGATSDAMLARAKQLANEIASELRAQKNALP